MNAPLVALWLAASPLTGPLTGPSQEGPTFIEDDYPRALARAKAHGRTLFVDAWAPWCHTCLSMRAYVFDRPELVRAESRYVFLALNTEKDQSAPFLEKFPVDVWPTLFIIDPADESVRLKWVGSATTEQLGRLLDDGDKPSEQQAKSPAESARMEGDRLFGRGKPVPAITAYRRALSLTKKTPTWERRPRVVESLLTTLYAAKRFPECRDAAIAEAPTLPQGPSYANVVVWGYTCAQQLNAPPAGTKASQRLATLNTWVREALSLPGLLPDDRSGLYEQIVDSLSSPGDEAQAKEWAGKWLTFLETEASRAPTPEARAVFDAHRLKASLAAGTPERAVAALEQSEKEFPQDYNPPARLAVALREQDQFDAALAAIERALPKAYGPRKVNLFETKATIQAKMNDPGAQRETLTQALVYLGTLPKPARREKTLQRLRAALEGLR